MKIYISLPISGLPADSARQHADAVKAALSRLGHTPLSPFDIYAGKNPSYTDYICYDLLALSSCDAIYFCKGWQHSCGCGIEHDFVMRLKAFNRRDFKIMYEE